MLGGQENNYIFLEYYYKQSNKIDMKAAVFSIN